MYVVQSKWYGNQIDSKISEGKCWVNKASMWWFAFIYMKILKKCTLWIGIIDFDKRRYKLSWLPFISTESKKGGSAKIWLIGQIE